MIIQLFQRQLLFALLLGCLPLAWGENCATVCINGTCTSSCGSGSQTIVASSAGCGATCVNDSCTSSCASVVGSGKLQSKSYDLQGFSQVVGQNAFDISITQGTVYQVKVTADKNVFQHLNVHQNGRVLYLSTEKNTILTNVTLQAAIIMPSLTKIKLSGISECVFSGFSSNRLKVVMSGTSHLTGESGTVNNLSVKLSGSSDLNLKEITSYNAKVRLGGASHAIISVNGALTGRLSGASTLDCYGTPINNTITTSGASEIKGCK
ncbi:hypothetical protein PN36_24575 [Candidatus Thiomargarita nelsonii]|uniref:Putative auto-transporter adhesin head GIN domain-containing protein n=1 Tax=Candidatus Thiomargarita nelsonii TaxID=1003181 RepID=A0A0A6PHH1_9GAMM|nr:hypothetical protein PN36_24575 [Candidatus Thiomargarita nelsonii]